jgi:hypothetical protein
MRDMILASPASARPGVRFTNLTPFIRCEDFIGNQVIAAELRGADGCQAFPELGSLCLVLVVLLQGQIFKSVDRQPLLQPQGGTLRHQGIPHLIGQLAKSRCGCIPCPLGQGFNYWCSSASGRGILLPVTAAQAGTQENDQHQQTSCLANKDSNAVVGGEVMKPALMCGCGAAGRGKPMVRQ